VVVVVMLLLLAWFVANLKNVVSKEKRHEYKKNLHTAQKTFSMSLGPPFCCCWCFGCFSVSCVFYVVRPPLLSASSR
jgi:Na+/melibiose symporter-like transporter